MLENGMRLLFATLGGFILGLLLQKIRQEPQTTQNQSSQTLSSLINQYTSHKVLQFDTEAPGHIVTVKIIRKAAQETIQYFNNQSLDTHSLRRINEVSRMFEDHLLNEINKHTDFQCTIPSNQNQKPLRSGYPDLLIEHLPTKTKCYLDPKLFETTSRKSSFRSFYYSPHSKIQKIHYDALHLLLGFEHDGKVGNWKFLDFQLIDLSELPLKLKMEFSTSNRELYTNEAL